MAITEYERFRPQLVFMDVKMAGIDGLEALKRLQQIDPNAVVVMISGHGTIQTAVEATQLGAYDILEKPLDTDRILVTLRNALEHLELSRGEHAAAADDRVAVRDRRPLVRDQGADRQDREGGADAGARADHRGERNGQGARGARAAPRCHRARRVRSSK